MFLRYLLFMLLVGCGVHPDFDGGAETPADSGASDAGLADAGALDAGPGDAGFDASVPADAGTDGGWVDAGFDAGMEDAGLDSGVDAGEPDAGFDAGTADAGRDAGVDAGFDAGWQDGGACPLGSGVGQPFRLRAMASNLSSGNAQSYDPGHGQRILQAMGADIVMMQEFNYGTNSDADITSFVNTTFDGGVGGPYAWYRGIGAQIPNGVLSRWPIIASGDWVDPLVGNRAFTWTRVDLPGPRDLWVVSLHLLTSNASERATEARSLMMRLSASVPASDFLIIGGDFNTTARNEQAVTEFSARLVTGSPWPVDNAGVGGTNASRAKPYDWVLASPCLHNLQIPVSIGSQSFAAGLVFDSTVYTPLSDVPPVLFGDSTAPSMQHMGVIRDFRIQP